MSALLVYQDLWPRDPLRYRVVLRAHAVADRVLAALNAMGWSQFTLVEDRAVGAL